MKSIAIDVTCTNIKFRFHILDYIKFQIRRLKHRLNRRLKDVMVRVRKIPIPGIVYCPRFYRT